VHNEEVSLGLQEIIAHWDALPEYIKKTILTLIHSIKQ
jgi:hypothetical protein